MANISERNGNAVISTHQAPRSGVPIGVHPDLDESERAASVTQPYVAFSTPEWDGAKYANDSGKEGSHSEAGPSSHFRNKLSGGAEAFQPSGSKTKPSPIRALNHDSTADDEPTIVFSPTPNAPKGKGKAKAVVQQPIGTRTGNVTPTREKQRFTTDVGPGMVFVGGHYIKIENITPATTDSIGYLRGAFNWHGKLRGYKGPPNGSESKTLTYFFVFDDINDAASAHTDVELTHASWLVRYISQIEYAGAPAPHGAHDGTSYYDGQLIFVARLTDPTHPVDAEHVFATVKQFAEVFGMLQAFVELQPSSDGFVEFRAEYMKISAAKSALRQAGPVSQHVVGELHIHCHELASVSQQAGVANDVAPLQVGMAGLGITTPPKESNDVSTFTNVSPTGRTAWRVDQEGHHVPAAPPMTLPKANTGYGIVDQAGPSRGRFNSAPAPQVHPMAMVDNGAMRHASWNGAYYGPASPPPNKSAAQAIILWKIERGQDVRTTVMMRNIPNKMTCWQLKEVLDQTSHGKYDFSYLRIDFQQGTNVGYAFVNFADPMDIAPFFRRHVDRPWTMGNNRRCEMSYATVQGYDCLVEKFRNSAIMSEFSDYRPKLWYSDDTAPTLELIGTEKPFPGPNNFSKQQRSHDNAGQVGLYPPKKGNQKNSRTHRSQFDRGTPSQLQEDAMFQQANQLALSRGGYADGEGAYAAADPRTPYVAGAPGGGRTFVDPSGNVWLPNAHGSFSFLGQAPVNGNVWAPGAVQYPVGPGFGNAAGYTHQPLGNGYAQAPSEHAYALANHQPMGHFAHATGTLPANGRYAAPVMGVNTGFQNGFGPVGHGIQH